MKKLLLFLFVLALSSNFFSQVQIQWQKSYGGTGPEFAQFIIQTTDGGYAAAGYTQSNNIDVSGNHGLYDGWVIKTDAQGNIQWQKCIGGTNWDYAFGIIQVADGGYIVAGYTGSNDGDFSGNHGSHDTWVVKLNSQGNIQWQKCLGGTGGDFAYSIYPTNDGGYVLAGYTGSNDGDVSGNHGAYDYWVVKSDSLSNIQWQKCLGGTANDEANSVIQTNDGSYIVVGYTYSNDGDVTVNYGLYDLWVVKLDSNGGIQMQKSLGGSSYDFGYSIIQTDDGNYAVAGYSGSSGTHGAWDFWIVKLDTQCNILWQKYFGGSDYDIAQSIVQIPDGSLIVAGKSKSNNYNVSGNNGGNDYWVVKLNSSGNLIWQKCLGGTNEDIALSIIKTSDGGYMVAGVTQSNDGDVSWNLGSADLWVVKFIGPNISGIVFHDNNNNGLLDSLEQGVSGHLIKLEPGPYYTFSNNEGKYYFNTDSGNYDITYIEQNYWYTTNVPLYDISIDSNNLFIDSLDFAVRSKINMQDVGIYIIGSSTRLDFETHYWLIYKNWGTITASGTINFEYDSLLLYNSSTYTPVSQIGNTLVFDYDTLGPGVQRSFRVDFQVPGVQYLGDTLFSNAWITPFVPDSNISNNYDTLYQIITGSYDPNDKSVSPSGYGPQGYVLHDQRLTYTVRFQNTGTDTAFTVVLRDTLDANLDIETFLVEAYSHNVSWELHSGNELQFHFNNILLPDSNINEPESHGFIRYSISPKSGLADYTVVSNTAYIFFDYNPAIVTNTTTNIYVAEIPENIEPVNYNKTHILTYPNPSIERVFINLPEFTNRVEVYNGNGEKMQSFVPEKSIAEINIKDFPAGTYIVKIITSKEVITTKIIKP